MHGHRGCRGLRPENTLPAFLHATALGVGVLELDVVLSADQQVVVSHEPWMSAAICLDPAGKRIEPAAQHQHNLYQLPYGAIRRYDCGQLQHPGFPTQQNQPAYKPLLREVVQQVDALTRRLGRGLMHYSVEVKSTPADDDIFHPSPAPYAAQVLAELRALRIIERTTLLCFDTRVLQAMRQLSPDMALCLLVEDALPLAQHIEQLGFVPAVYGPQHRLVTPELVAAVRALNMRLVPWTVNAPDDMARMLSLGISAITTDYPDRLLRILAA